MGFLSLTRKCRPIRLGFLVRPGRPADLRRAVEINTVLWGGVRNPIIPLYRQIPHTWADGLHDPPSAKAVLRGYIATFQPDFLVKPKNVSLLPGTFPEGRVLELADVLPVPRPGERLPSRSPIGYGLDMMDVYRDAYRKVHQFVQRHPGKYQIPILRGQLRVFGMCLWGAFPAEADLGYYAKTFEKVFEAKTKAYHTATTLLRDTFVPLDMTTYELEQDGGAPEPCVFLLDAGNPVDLIDYWNLRACGGRCAPLPLSALKELASDVRHFMHRHLRRLADNDKQLTYPYLVGSRSLKKDTVKGVMTSLGLDPKHRLILGHYPRLWAKREASWDQATPARFYCEEQHGHIDGEGGHLSFDALHPKFAARFGQIAPRWMNVITLDEHYPETLPASVIPDGIEKVERVFEHYPVSSIWTNDDGIVIPCEYKKWRHHLTMPDASRIGEEWARAKGYKMELSDSGHILQSMVNVAGGLFEGRWFANEDIIQALGQMAEGRKAEERAVPVGKFRGILEKANHREDSTDGVTDRHLEYFKDKGILRLCLKVQCPHCRQHPWYALEELAHRLECRHCLRGFAFPLATPPTEQAWGYRPVGPFASPGYAQGAYSVFLAMRFLTEQLDARTTCVPSCKLIEDSREWEVDLICFWQRQSWSDSGRHVIFGECKCFGDFEAKDIRRMKEVVSRFPGSIAAFCTLKPALSAREKCLIARFAESGRKPRKGESWPVPVLVLTSNELCVMTPGRVRYQWGASNAVGLSAKMPRGDWNMLDLCSASQEEYLGLSSRYEWVKQFYEKKSRRRGTSPVQGQNISAGLPSEPSPAPLAEPEKGSEAWQHK